MSDPLPGRFAGRRVYVTGATGFIGGHLVDALLAEGAEVTALARPSERAKVLALKGVAVHEGSVTDPRSIVIERQDIVIHGAAWVGYGIPRRKRSLFRATNVDATRHVLDAARAAGARKAIHVSSIAALGRAPGVMTEETRTDRAPISLYEETKRAAHAIALEYPDLQIALPMPGLVVGVGSAFDPLLAAAARGRVPVGLAGDATKGWVHVRDVVEATLAMAAGPARGPFLLVSDNMPTSEFFARFAKLAGAKPPKALVPAGLLRAGATLVERAYNAAGRTPPVSGELLRGLSIPMTYDASRARQALGWSPDLWGNLRRDLPDYREM
ncbi:MAG TPA: NAD-dependent epimerase/dehydratase family protein [Candidatus Thermoplasmatota archaeon]|nr:NAD-dependent epimerase/dehydratase family protein [Candidatus Thermoplasmatota archaeon]